jgi:cytochrome oxidase Cu insertion factor (SCO1/SenC/PrrC family)
MCVSKRKVTIAVVAVLVIVAVIVGVVVAMLLKSGTNSCDESSSSLAKRLPCVSQDESKFCFDWLWQQYWCVFITWTTFILVCHFSFYSLLVSLRK